MSDNDGPGAHTEQVEELVRRLAETAAALQTLTGGQVDALVDPVSGAYFLLHQAQAERQRAHDELERWVQERTAELEQANAALQAEIVEHRRANAALQAEIAERQRAQATLQRYAGRLEIFREVDEAILAAHSANEIAEIGLEHLGRLLSCTWASVVMFDWEASEAEVLASQTDGEVSSGKGGRAPLTSTLLDLVSKLREGQGQVIQDIGLLAPVQSPERTRGCTVLPLRARGELIGTLNLAVAGSDPLDEEQMALIREVTNQLAAGLRQVHLCEQVQRYALTLEQRVTERTTELHASEARLQAIFDQAGIGIAVLDRDGYLGETNAKLWEMTGYGEQELRGQPFTRFIPPAEVEDLVGRYRQRFAGTGDDQPERREVQFGRKDGLWRWATVTISLIRQPAGNPQFAIAIIEDITEQKETREALIRSEKLANTGRLAASLAHEIGSPLQSVLGCLGLAEQHQAGGQDSSPYCAWLRKS